MSAKTVVLFDGGPIIEHVPDCAQAWNIEQAPVDIGRIDHPLVNLFRTRNGLACVMVPEEFADFPCDPHQVASALWLQAN